MVKQSIVPAIIPLSYTHLEQRLREVRTLVRSVQIDVMDGTYTDTVSWPYAEGDHDLFAQTRREDSGLPYWQVLDLEIDLMVSRPELHIERWALAGAARLIVHVESTSNLELAVSQCIDRRLEVALALKPDTSEDCIEPYVDRVVFVQCMGSRRIGKHGVSLDPTVLEKIARMHARWPDMLIGVDIGVNQETIAGLYQAGARRFAAGSAVYGMGDPARAIRSLTDVLNVNSSSA